MDTVQVTADITMLRFPVGQAYLVRVPADSGPAGARLAALDTGTALFGHGEPLTGDAGAALRAAAGAADPHN